MQRREFLSVVGGAAVTWPLIGRAQQKLPLIGFLHPSSLESNVQLVAAFKKGLNQAGYVEGRNVSIEYRWAHDDLRQLPELATELVRRQAAVIVSPVGTAAALAAKAATSTIPVVFSVGTDAVQVGLVASFNRPGGNVTGISFIATDLGAKRLEILLELRPRAERIGLLVNSSNRVATEAAIKDTQSAALARGRQVAVFMVADATEIGAEFANMVQRQIEGLSIAPDPLFTRNRVSITTYATRHALPVVYALREFAEAGGLMSYGANLAESYRLVGDYAGRILKGERPADMPVQRPTKFEFVINLQTARALNITIPPTLLARADEVIE